MKPSLLVLSMSAAAALGMSACLYEKEEPTSTSKEAASSPVTTETKDSKPSPTDKDKEKKMETITLGGGCFWCIEAPLQRVKGIDKVVSGYTGGKTKNPTYDDICTGVTGHAEVVQITFDPATISMEQVLKIFFQMHDPTQLNRQGSDYGTQYRSAIFYATDAQKAAADKVIAELSGSGEYSRKIVTEVTPLTEFYKAEDYHQDYFNTNFKKGTGNIGYLCHITLPKVEKLHKLGVELKDEYKKESLEKP